MFRKQTYGHPTQIEHWVNTGMGTVALARYESSSVYKNGVVGVFLTLHDAKHAGKQRVQSSK